MSTVGFIGIGQMGSNMSSNLLKNGRKVVVYDSHPDATKPLVAKGATAASNIAEIAGQSDHIITMLPTPDIVKQVYRGADGVFANAKKGSILIDSSTVGPEPPQELVIEAKSKGLIFVDAPVTGAVPAARDGTLTFLVGGTESEANSVKDLLMSMGKNVIHCGPTGSGQIAKICNNMCLAITMIGTAETLALAKRLGLDPKLMTDILNISSGRSWSSEVYNPAPGIMSNVPSSNDYKPGFSVELLAKDLGLAQTAATRVKAPLPLGGPSHQVYLTMQSNGWAKKDFSSVYKFLEGKP